MSVRFEVGQASGRATCKICKKIIEKGVVQVTAYAYQSQGSVHISCLEKKDLNGRD